MVHINSIFVSYETDHWNEYTFHCILIVINRGIKTHPLNADIHRINIYTLLAAILKHLVAWPGLRNLQLVCLPSFNPDNWSIPFMDPWNISFIFGISHASPRTIYKINELNIYISEHFHWTFPFQNELFYDKLMFYTLY